MVDYNLDKRKYVIGGVAIAIVVIYAIRLFTLQIMSEDYKKNADSNAFLKQIEFPSRGAIYDRNGKLMVYNSPSYDIMVVMKEQEGRLDTMDFCNSLGITKEAFEKRMETIKDRNKNPGYSRYTQQLFMSQLSDKDFSVFQEKMFRFPGFYVQKRSVREYVYPYAAHVLGDVGEVSPSDIEEDDYYQPGDYIGKLGLEKHYEKELRGTKGVKIMLRDARGRIQGSYQNGKLDQRPVAGKDLTLGIDVNLQALGERLLQGKIGSIVAIDPRDGSVLAYPDIFSRIAPMSGSIKTTADTLKTLETMPIWAFVGEDDVVVKPESTETFIESVSEQNSDARVTVFEATDHVGVLQKAWLENGKALLNWLLQ